MARKWTHIADLRDLLSKAAAEPGSKLVAIAVGASGQEQTLERRAVATVAEASTWASGILKGQARVAEPAVRFRWINAAGKKASSVICRLEDSLTAAPEPPYEPTPTRHAPPPPAAVRPTPPTPTPAPTPDQETARLSASTEVAVLRQQLAQAESRARQAEARVEQAERRLRDVPNPNQAAAQVQALQGQLQQMQERLSTAEAEVRRSLSDNARIARERDGLRNELQEARDAIARKDVLLAEATKLAKMVNRSLKDEDD